MYKNKPEALTHNGSQNSFDIADSDDYSKHRESEPMSRIDAARILENVANAGEAGLVAHHSPHEVGRALYRILSNIGADGIVLRELIKGFRGE